MNSPVCTFPDSNTHTAADSGESDLTVVQEAAKLIGHSATPEFAITGILRMMSQMLGLNRGRVIMPSTTDEKLRIRYSYGLRQQECRRGSYQYGEGITGKVMSSGQVAVVQNIDEEPGYLLRAVDRETLPPEVVAYLAVPIMDGQIPIGVLASHRLRMRPRPFDADLVVLRILATFIAQIIKINSLIDERTNLLRHENQELKTALQSQHKSNHGILGESAAIRNVLHQVRQVADTPVTVLLTGESGTGKERFSQILHLDSSRREQPFLALNCAAIPEQLLESELFGHERGAFTGATACKKGKIELASGGTLFLDEIGDLSMELQSKLLRVLENQTIQRVGGVKDIAVDVRVIAATHKNLQEAVNADRFRLDLFYRLNVFPVHLPPLRERGDDVSLLARHFLISANREYHRQTVFGQGVIDRLKSYNWPGNIRQLENVIKRAVLITENGTIGVGSIEAILSQESAISHHREAGREHRPVPGQTPLSPGLPKQPVYNDSAAYQASRPYSWVREDEAEAISSALRQTGGNKTRAAALLSMTPRQFRYRIEKLAVTTP